MATLRPGLLALLACIFFGGAILADEKPTLEEAQRKWKRDAKRPPLQLRWRAMFDLATTGEPDARDILMKRYQRPRAPKDHERYLIASLVGEFFNEADDVAPLQAFARKNTRDRDAWLWFNVLRTACRAERPEWVAEIACDPRQDGFARAAALETLARAEDQPAIATLDAVLQGLDREKGLDLALLLEAGTSVLCAERVRATDEAYQATAMRLLERLKAKDVTDRTRLTVARQLGRAFDVERLTLDPGYWQQVVQHQQEVARDGHTLARPRFGGLEATGTRIAYLIDMSESMVQTLSPGVLEELEVGVDVLDEGRLRGIESRFDLARELLRASLSQLSKDTRFVVIGFGAEARYLEATPGLVQAVPRKVAQAMKEIDALSSATGLWTATNMHGAFLRAFQATEGRPLKEDEHVLEKGFERGCDTIFLLSDGEPTIGDFNAWDVAEVGTLKGDAEKGNAKPIEKEERIYFWCPYRWSVNVMRDLRRLNLFRKVEIHCLGTGEADEKLLEQIAEVGMGRVRVLGR